MYIVIIAFWVSSMSDDHLAVYLENASSPEQAKRRARARLDYITDNQIDHYRVKEASEANIGLVYMQD